MKFLWALAWGIRTQSLASETSGDDKALPATEPRFVRTLSATWSEASSALADQGFSLLLRHAQNFDGLLTGLLHNAAAFSRRIDAMLNLDRGKLGLWQGGALQQSGADVLLMGRKINADERLTLLEAPECITLWSAYQHFEEKTKGSLETGKLADLVVLSDNPLTCDPAAIGKIKVLETIKEGRTVYRAQ